MSPLSSRVDDPRRAVRHGSLAAWLVAIRPRSLPVAISPVLVGAAFGWARAGEFDLIAAALVLAASLLMQVVTNMQNDVGYTARGAERHGTRTGLPRATAHGWLQSRHVRAAIVAVSVLAAAIGVWLFLQRGWPVLAIGVASLLAALAYMGGPRPIAYTPFGELTVFVFFGLVAVMGTDWVLTGEVGAASALAAAALGGLAGAALAINNHRDIVHDRQVGRRTFAVTFGERASQRLFTVLLLGPFALLPAIAATMASAWLLLPVVLLPAAGTLRRDFLRCPPGVAFNGLLFRCFLLQLVFAALLAVGAVLARVGGS
ncbi:MAG: 1,4-dihydroxy-2-naphthoate octaprenyltransferase [Ideonella sp.]|jgi:1,4-dihydroxy-2-naphthoate octaprenyltransferase|nr:1,4-dihydroxy-2-naphthoate octaprenyltransferase [Ideonella sp.]